MLEMYSIAGMLEAATMLHPDSPSSCLAFGKGVGLYLTRVAELDCILAQFGPSAERQGSKGRRGSVRTLPAASHGKDAGRAVDKPGSDAWRSLGFPVAMSRRADSRPHSLEREGEREQHTYRGMSGGSSTGGRIATPHRASTIAHG